MRTPACSAVVRLEVWEHEWAYHVGLQRHTIRLDSRDAAHYDPARMEDNLHASRASACVELAVAKYKGLYWSGHYWPVEDHDIYKGLADVGEYIEVRRVREPHNPLAVRKRDVAANRLMVCGWADPETDYQTVYLVGQMRAEQAWMAGYPSDYDPRNTRLVLQAFLDRYDE